MRHSLSFSRPKRPMAKCSQYSKKTQGFTLIEVLVSSLILFMTITAMFSLYRGSLLSSNKAERSLDYANQVMQIKSVVSHAIRQSSGANTLSNSGQMGPVGYRWEASVVQVGVAEHPENFPIERIADLGINSPDGATPIYLWRVDMTMTLENSQREFEFWELSW